MRSARIFLVGMYIHLFLSIVVPIGMILLKDRCWSSVGIGLFLGYLLMIGAVHLTGWISAGMAVSAYRSGEWEMLIKGWKLLKLSSIPFYILNFIYSLLAWIMLIGASRGLLIFSCAHSGFSYLFHDCTKWYLWYLCGQISAPDGEMRRCLRRGQESVGCSLCAAACFHTGYCEHDYDCKEIWNKMTLMSYVINNRIHALGVIYCHK